MGLRCRTKPGQLCRPEIWKMVPAFENLKMFWADCCNGAALLFLLRVHFSLHLQQILQDHLKGTGSQRKLISLTTANLVNHLHTVPKPKNIHYIKSILLAAMCSGEIKSVEIQSALHHSCSSEPLSGALTYTLHIFVHTLFFSKSLKFAWRSMICCRACLGELSLKSVDHEQSPPPHLQSHLFSSAGVQAALPLLATEKQPSGKLRAMFADCSAL